MQVRTSIARKVLMIYELNYEHDTTGNPAILQRRAKLESEVSRQLRREFVHLPAPTTSGMPKLDRIPPILWAYAFANHPSRPVEIHETLPGTKEAIYTPSAQKIGLRIFRFLEDVADADIYGPVLVKNGKFLTKGFAPCLFSEGKITSQDIQEQYAAFFGHKESREGIVYELAIPLFPQLPQTREKPKKKAEIIQPTIVIDSCIFANRYSNSFERLEGPRFKYSEGLAWRGITKLRKQYGVYFGDELVKYHSENGDTESAKTRDGQEWALAHCKRPERIWGS